MAKSKSKPSSEEPSPAPASTEYTVVARRYRPQQLADLIGQEHVAAALTNALNSGRVAHAYLFTGARGVGKTSSARILAKSLNCVKGPTPTPCDQCDICKAVAVGEDIDVLEIDGASNNKVDEIRDLRNNVGFRPTRARYKIYIIDEVHMLTTSAFNALLKTLEEPPPHVKFILATTEVQKIPITILSRCQRFDFAHVSTAKIFAALKHVVSKEGLKADEEALQIIAKRAAGSMRDSQSLLDQLLAFADGNLTAEKVHTLFGTASDDRILTLADAILSGDAKTALEEIHTCAARGLQLGELVDQLIDHWRGMMLLLSAGPTFSELNVSSVVLEKLKAQAAQQTLDSVLAGLDVLAATKQKMRGSSYVQILIEMAVVRLSRLDGLLSIGQLASALLGAGPIPVGKPGTAGGEPAKKKPLIVEKPPAPGAILANSETNVEVLWSQLLEKMGPFIGTLLRQGGSPAILGPNNMAIRFPMGYSSFSQVAGESTIESISLALRKITGATWTVRVEQSRDLPNRTETSETAKPAAPVGIRSKDVMQLPLFKSATVALGAQLIRMDEGFNPAAAVAPTPTPASVPEPIIDEDE
jgi:DNA polymerase III subunit gamma/tau